MHRFVGNLFRCKSTKNCICIVLLGIYSGVSLPKIIKFGSDFTKKLTSSKWKCLVFWATLCSKLMASLNNSVLIWVDNFELSNRCKSVNSVVIGSSPPLAYYTIFIVMSSEVVDLHICTCIRTSHCLDLCTRRLRAAAALP